MISRHNVQRFRYPERFLAELIRSYVSGEFVSAIENVPMVRRALVLAVDLDGGRLENNDGLGEVVVDTPGSGNVSYRATVGVDNPPNSVRARIMTAGADQFVGDDRVRTFWPFFPEHLAVPVKPGEHIYVMFEDRDFQHGLWLGKVAGHVGLNVTRGESSLVSGRRDRLSGLFDLEVTPTVSIDDTQVSDSFVRSQPLSRMFFGD